MQAGHNYRPDIDGLRALAVLPVVFYHAGFESFSGGYVGVDVFFVISGYLITSIIAREIESDTFSLSHFYERRARRLFPALFTVLAATAVGSFFLLMPWELEDFGQSLATTAIFSSNFLFFTEAGYFDGPAEMKPLLHTWSLAIEEQYYLLFPAFLFAVRNFLGGRYIGATAGLFIASFVISVWSTYAAPDAAFYLLPSRTWELMLGSLIALGTPMISKAGLRQFTALLGVALVLTAVFLFQHDTRFPGLAALVPCIGTALIIIAGMGSQSTAVGKLLSWKPIVAVGLISYSLYLWHWPVLVLAKHYLLRPLDGLEASVLVGFSLLLAYVSWRFVEKPFRGKDALLDRRGVFRWSGGAILGLIVIGLVFDETEGLSGRLPADVAQIAAVADDKPPERKRCEGIDPAEVTYQRVCRLNELEVPPSFAVWGDSHAMALMPNVGTVAHDLGLNGLNFSSNGCAPLLGVHRPRRDPEKECAAFSAAVFDILRQHAEVEHVILIARWARHAHGTTFGAEIGETYYLANAAMAAASEQENLVVFDEALQMTVAELVSIGKRVSIVGSTPEVGVHLPDVLAKSLWHGRPHDVELTRQAYVARQQAVAPMLVQAGFADAVYYFDPANVLCAGAQCLLVSDEGMPLYFDDNHLSRYGGKLLEPLLQQVLNTQ